MFYHTRGHGMKRLFKFFQPYLRIFWIAGAIWLLYSVIQTLRQHSPLLPEPSQGPLWGKTFVIELRYVAGWIVVTPLIYMLCRRYYFRKGKRLQSFFVHLGVGVSVAMLHHSIMAVLIALFHTDVPFLSALSVRLQPTTFFHCFDSTVVLYWAIVIVCLSIHHYNHYREQQHRVTLLEVQVTESRLQALKMQLQPHFLFNTLNSISSLLYKDIRAADTMIESLGAFLRLTLETADVHITTLRDELTFIRYYLDIEQQRFGDNLRVEYDIHEETLSAAMPHLLLQPLVENAIRHGISGLLSGGYINIGATVNDEVLHLWITNNGNFSANETAAIQTHSGIGLANTRRRLQLLYGDRQTLDYEQNDRTVTVFITLPYQMVEPESISSPFQHYETPHHLYR